MEHRDGGCFSDAAGEENSYPGRKCGGSGRDNRGWARDPGVKGAGFGGVIEGFQSDVKGALDVGSGAGDIDEETIGVSAGNVKMVGVGESLEGGVVGCGGAEFSGKLLRREEMVEIGGGRVVDVTEKSGEGGLSMKRQGDGEPELGGVGQGAGWCKRFCDCRDVGGKNRGGSRRIDRDRQKTEESKD